MRKLSDYSTRELLAKRKDLQKQYSLYLKVQAELDNRKDEVVQIQFEEEFRKASEHFKIVLPVLPDFGKVERNGSVVFNNQNEVETVMPMICTSLHEKYKDNKIGFRSINYKANFQGPGRYILTQTHHWIDNDWLDYVIIMEKK